MDNSDVNIVYENTYYIAEHETLLSFNEDEQNEFFQRWWHRIGKADFIRWYNINREKSQ